MSNSLSKGIICHENDQLAPAAYYFFRSCREENHPLAFYFLGMCLRHGLGIAKNETEAFKCLQNCISFLIEKLPIIKSHTGSLIKYPTPAFEFSLRVEADSVWSDAGEKIPAEDQLQQRFDVPELFNGYTTNEEQKVKVEIEIIKTFLALPIYELGNSLLNGWGVAKSKLLAEKMYTIGARIGDIDCQLALIFLYQKVNFQTRITKQNIVYWLREAARNGSTSYGQSWIWEKKYDGVELNRDKVLIGDDLKDLDTISELVKDFNENIKLSKPPTNYCLSACIKTN
jgi:hypothetical protein